jgi:hypothetical protein
MLDVPQRTVRSRRELAHVRTDRRAGLDRTARRHRLDRLANRHRHRLDLLADGNRLASAGEEDGGRSGNSSA